MITHQYDRYTATIEERDDPEILRHACGCPTVNRFSPGHPAHGWFAGKVTSTPCRRHGGRYIPQEAHP